MATTTSADTPRDALEKVDDFGMVWIVDFNVGC
jgi:tRNA-dihydrouridine synthase